MDTYALRQQVEDIFMKRLIELEGERKKQLEAIDIVSKLSAATPQSEKDKYLNNTLTVGSSFSRGTLRDIVYRIDEKEKQLEAINIVSNLSAVALQPGKEESSVNEEISNSLKVGPEASTGGLTDADMIRSAFGSIKISESFTKNSLKDIYRRMFPGREESHFGSSFTSTMHYLAKRGCIANVKKGKGGQPTIFKKKADYIKEMQVRVDSKASAGIRTLADMIRSAFGSIKVGESFTRTSLLDIACRMFPVAFVGHGSFSSTIKYLEARGCVSVLSERRGLTPKKYIKNKDYNELHGRGNVPYTDTTSISKMPERPLIANEEHLDPLTVDSGMSEGDQGRSEMIRSVFRLIKVGDSFTRASFRNIYVQMFPGTEAARIFHNNFSSTLRYLDRRGCFSILSQGNGLTPTRYIKKADCSGGEIPNHLTVDFGPSIGELKGADMVRSAFGSVKVGGSFTINTLKDVVSQMFPGKVVNHGSFASTMKFLTRRGCISMLLKGKGTRPAKYKKKLDYTELHFSQEDTRTGTTTTGKTTESQLNAYEEYLNTLKDGVEPSKGDLVRADMIRCAFRSIKVGDSFTRASFTDIVSEMFPGKNMGHGSSFSGTIKLLKDRGCIAILSKRKGSVPAVYIKKADSTDLKLREKNTYKTIERRPSAGLA